MLDKLKNRISGSAASFRRRSFDEDDEWESEDGQEERFFNSRRIRYIVIAALIVVSLVAAFAIRHAIIHHKYGEYSVMSSEERLDSVSQYEFVDGRILKYSADGASLMTRQQKTIWNVTYEMTNPTADISGKEIVIYDKKGTAVQIYNEEGRQNTFTAGGPIITARVSGNGNVAAILDQDSYREIVYYASDGALIASGQTSMTDPGFPVAAAISDDGETLAVSFVTVTNGTAGSLIRFYNFGQAGKTAGDNIVAEESFDGIVVPKLDTIGSTIVAFRDDGFTVYKIGTKPAAVKSVDFSDEIVSVFHDDDHIGVVFRSEDKESKYTLKLYTVNGKLLSTGSVNVSYDIARVSDNQIIFYSNSEFAVYSMEGICKYEGAINEGNVADILRIASNRYLVLTDKKTEIIKLG